MTQFTITTRVPETIFTYLVDWNSLSLDIRDTSIFSYFKSKLKHAF